MFSFAILRLLVSNVPTRGFAHLLTSAQAKMRGVIRFLRQFGAKTALFVGRMPPLVNLRGSGVKWAVLLVILRISFVKSRPPFVVLQAPFVNLRPPFVNLTRPAVNSPRSGVTWPPPFVEKMPPLVNLRRSGVKSRAPFVVWESPFVELIGMVGLPPSPRRHINVVGQM